MNLSYTSKLKQDIENGYQITKVDALKLCAAPLEELSSGANQLRGLFCGNAVDLCAIINGKSGKCSENCKYCAQSGHYPTNVEQYPLLETESILKEAIYDHERGVLRFSIVTSGRNLSDEEIEELCHTYNTLKANCPISLCASHGLLSLEQFQKLKACGVSRYHNNLETSRGYFPNVCTTHTYDDKLNTLRNARKAGMELCSGGIIGMGETMEDRIDMALELRELGVKSVPVNILNPIEGTPFAKLPQLTHREILRTIGILRFIMPDAAIRLAGGRGLLEDKGKTCFLSGANAAISGDMLTTSGISISQDMAMLKAIKFEVKML